MSFATRTWWTGLLCGFGVVLAILCTYPVAEMGFLDDFSYIRSAFDFAQTGRFVYHGWASAMLGWQIVWGALFARCFGYSFTAVRSSMIVVDAAAVWLFYASLVRFGAQPRNAVFGALTFGFSPLFVPLAATFMTDVSGAFVILLCLYLCQRALAARTEQGALSWLIFASLTNVVGGTVRQIAWLGALVMVPSAVWLMRKRRHILRAGVALWIVSAAAIFGCLHWWNQQPYSLPEKILGAPVTGAMIAHLLGQLCLAFGCSAFLLFPLLAAWIPQFRTLGRVNQIALAVLLLVLGVFVLWVRRQGDLGVYLAPWLAHVIGELGMFSVAELLGRKPVTFTYGPRTVISFIIIAVTWIFVSDAVTSWRRLPSPTSADTSSREDDAPTLLFVLPFVLAYFALLLPRALYVFFYDRYLLGVLPFLILPLVLLHQRRFGKAISAWVFVLLGCLSTFYLAGTHDWFSYNRARIQAVGELNQEGVPSTRVAAGFDFDGWTQLEVNGHINEIDVAVPRGAYRPVSMDTDLAAPCRTWFTNGTPDVKADYFVVFSPMPCLSPSAFPPVAYRAWLPPFTRSLSIQTRPRSTPATQAP